MTRTQGNNARAQGRTVDARRVPPRRSRRCRCSSRRFRRMVRGRWSSTSARWRSRPTSAPRSTASPFTALPVFLVRGFHHGAILYNRDGRHRAPERPRGPAGRRQPRLHGDHRRLGARHPGRRVRRRPRRGDLGAVRRRARRRATGRRPTSCRATPGSTSTQMLARRRPRRRGRGRDRPPRRRAADPRPAGGGLRGAARARPLPDQPPRRRQATTLLAAQPGAGAAPSSTPSPRQATSTSTSCARARSRTTAPTGCYRAGHGDDRQRPAALRHRAEPRGARGAASTTPSASTS